MSIPLTASTETFVPECMAGIEGAPSFTFRHATELDKYEFGIHCTAEGLKSHGTKKVRETILSELRRLFEGEGLEANITRLETFWQADDDLAEAEQAHRAQVLEILSDTKDGDPVDLPPAPELDFPKHDLHGIELMLAQVNEHSEILSLMTAQNLRYNLLYPRMLLRIFLASTTLPVVIQRRGDVVTPGCCEAILRVLAKEAKRLKVKPETATAELMAKARLSFLLTGDEEKNSSSPRSDTTSPAQSKSKASTGPQTEAASKSSDPATSDAASGCTSSD